MRRPTRNTTRYDQPIWLGPARTRRPWLPLVSAASERRDCCCPPRSDHSRNWRRTVIAGAFGFLALSQRGVRPNRYGDPSRFDTMPSQPSLHACLKIMAPSPSKCSLGTMFVGAPRSSFASRCLRCSIGSRRKSSPSNSRTSNAQWTAAALVCCLRISSKRPNRCRRTQWPRHRSGRSGCPT